MNSIEGADETQRRELRRLRVDLGAVVSEALDSPEVIEVILNSDGALWAERFGQPLEPIGTMSAWQAEALIRTVAALLKTVVTYSQPCVEGQLPDGSRFAGQIPPVVKAPGFAIR